MIRRTLSLIGLATLLALGPAPAFATIVAGFLNNPANPALLASDGYRDLRAPRFDSNGNVVRNVAVYALTVLTSGTFDFASSGYSFGGSEPYFSLFAGGGPGATFIGSNYFDPAIDFDDAFVLSSGSYLIALGVWANASFAENNPDADPAFGDGFTALGDPTRLGSGLYRVEVTSGDGGTFTIVAATGLVTTPTGVPEPATWALMGLGLLAFGLRRRATVR